MTNCEIAQPLRFLSGPALAVFAASLASVGACSRYRTAQPPDLPPIPEAHLNHFAPLARSIVDDACKSLHKDPLDPDLNGRLAMIFHGHEMYTAAIPVYLRAEKLAPEDFRWPYLRARCVFFTGTTQEELQLLQDAYPLRPDYGPLLIELGECLTRLARCAEARQYFERVTLQSPDSARAWLGIGQTFVKESKWVEAENALRTSMKSNPESRSTHYLLGVVLSRLGRPREADAEFAELRDLKEELPPVDDDILSQALRMGIGREAMEAFQQASEFELQGRWPEAKGIYDGILKLNPDYVPAICQLGAVSGRLGQWDEARRLLFRARNLDPRHAYSASNLGWILTQLGEHQDAIPHLKSAIEMDPYLIDAYLSLSIAYRETRQIDKAIGTLQLAAQSNVEHPMVYYLLAETLISAGRKQDAIDALRNGIRKGDPGHELSRYLQQIESEPSAPHSP